MPNVRVYTVIMIKREEILKANTAGLKHRETGNFWSYYTPTLQMAYNLGQKGIYLSEAPVVSGWRVGKAPESYISRNYRDDLSEPGLSLMAIYDHEVNAASALFIDNRKSYTYTGILSGTGSDGEPCILCFEAENLD